MAPRYASPLRYPGGKSRMASWVAQALFESSAGRLDTEILLEPFCGGAGASLTGLFQGWVEEAWVVEFNTALAAFWSAATRDGVRLARRIAATTPTLDGFYQARALVAETLTRGNLGDADPFEVGYAAFILNRCSRSGMILPQVGPIGGKTQAGRNLIGDRFNAHRLSELILSIHGLGERFKIIHGDGIAHLASLPGSGIEDEVFAFVDPPYVGVGNDLYAAGMSAADHQRLADALHGLDTGQWALTYDAHPAVLDLYPEERVLECTAWHRNNVSKVGAEYLVLGDAVPTPTGNPMGDGSMTLVVKPSGVSGTVEA